MTHKERYINNITDTYAEAILTVRSKVDDYAKDGDAFSNFRFAAQSAGVTVEQVLLVLLGVKLARLGNLVTSGLEPNHESIEDTLVDQINYSAILRAYIEFKNSTDEDYAYSDSTEPADAEVPLADLHPEWDAYDGFNSAVGGPQISPVEEVPEPSALARLGSFFGFTKPN